jgi:hypothetical protein
MRLMSQFLRGDGRRVVVDWLEQTLIPFVASQWPIPQVQKLLQA